MPKYEEDDAFEWGDYERFALNPGGVKLKDLNRKNLRHIQVIKKSWNRQRVNHIQFIDHNPFTPFRYTLKSKSKLLSKQKKKQGGSSATISAALNQKAPRRTSQAKKKIREIHQSN